MEYYNHHMGALGLDSTKLLSFLSVGAGTASSAATLTALGVSAQAVPVVGQVLGGIALVAGFIATSQAKAKSIKSSVREVDAQNAELRLQSVEVDKQIVQANTLKQSIQSQITALGLQGTHGLGSITGWLKETFTPAKVAQEQLTRSTTENNSLVNQINGKIAVLQNILTEFEALKAKFIKANTTQKVLAIGGTVIVAGGIGYLIYKAVKK
jgi:hypothetical protein